MDEDEEQEDEIRVRYSFSLQIPFVQAMNLASEAWPAETPTRGNLDEAFSSSFFFSNFDLPSDEIVQQAHVRLWEKKGNL